MEREEDLFTFSPNKSPHKTTTNLNLIKEIIESWGLHLGNFGFIPLKKDHPIYQAIEKKLPVGTSYTRLNDGLFKIALCKISEKGITKDRISIPSQNDDKAKDELIAIQTTLNTLNNVLINCVTCDDDY